MRLLLLWASIQSIICMTSAVAAQEAGPGADRTPAEIRKLPSDLKSELDRRGCTIPSALPLSSNAVRGQFAKRGEFDWAVLCRSQHITTLLVFRNGSNHVVIELSVMPNNDGVSDWYIRPVGKDFIQRHYVAYGGPKPPPINHDGIESGDEHASIVFYCYKGKWLHLQGAD